MNATKLFAFTLLTAVAGAALAGESDASQIRTGEGYSTPDGQFVFSGSDKPSTLTRAAVDAQVAQARIDKTLMPAGAALYGSRAMYDKPSILVRADVKAEVLRARVDGTLMPAGEGYAVASRPVGPSHFTWSQARLGR